MPWTHRVIATETQGERCLALHEVHYNGAGKLIGYTLDPEPVVGETLDELRQTLDWMRKALERPILVADQDGILREESLTPTPESSPPRILTVEAVQQVMQHAGYAEQPLRATANPGHPDQVYVVSVSAKSSQVVDDLLCGLAPHLRAAGWHVIPLCIKVDDGIVLWAALDIRQDATDDPGGIRWHTEEEHGPRRED